MPKLQQRTKADAGKRTRAKLCGRCSKRPRRAGQRWCRECHAEHQRLTRRTYGELTDAQRTKLKVRAKLRRAVSSGKIAKPATCSIRRCTETKLQAHHADYRKPLVVTWLCETHHRALHSNGGKP